MTPFVIGSINGFSPNDYIGQRLGELGDCISCTVSSDLTGKYELKLVYPDNGWFADQFEIGQCIVCWPSLYYVKSGGDHKTDFFVIYKISASPGSAMTINAEHISYHLAKEIAQPYTITDVTNQTQVNTALFSILQTLTEFKAICDLTTPGTLVIPQYTTVREVINKITETYGGYVEYRSNSLYGRVELWFRDNLAHNTFSKPWTYAYGSSIKTFKEEISDENAYTHIFPYFKNGTTVVISNVTNNTISTGWTRGGMLEDPCIKPVDLTNRFSSTPTQAQVTAMANKYISENTWGPTLTMTVEPSPDLAFQAVHLGDYVDVLVEKYGIGVQHSNVSALEYDVINERNTKMTIGTIKTTLAKTLNGIAGGIL